MGLSDGKLVYMGDNDLCDTGSLKTGFHMRTDLPLSKKLPFNMHTF